MSVIDLLKMQLLDVLKIVFLMLDFPANDRVINEMLSYRRETALQGAL